MAIVGSAEVRIHADTSGIRGEIAKGLRTALRGINAQVKVDLDARGVFSGLAKIKAELAALTGRVHTIELDVDSAGALRDLAIVQAQVSRLDGRKININVDVDRGGGGLAGLLGLSRGTDSAGDSMDGMRTKTKVLATLLLGLLGPALGLIAGAVAALPGLIAIAGAAAGVIALGIEGIKNAANSMDDSLAKVKERLSATFENGLTPLFDRLGKLLEKMSDGMHDVAHSLIGVVEGFTDVVTSAEGVEHINDTLANTARFFDRLTPGIKSFTDSFLILADIGSATLVGLANEFTRATGEFNEFIRTAASSGLLRDGLIGLNDTFGGLFDMINSIMFVGLELSAVLGGPLGTTFTTFGALLEGMGPLLGALGLAFLTLVSTFNQLLLPVVAALGPHLMTIATAMTGPLSTAVTTLSPFLSQIGQAFGQMLTAVVPLIDPIIRIATIVAQLLASALQSALPLIMALANAFGQALTTALTLLEPLWPVIMQAFDAIMQALLPLVPVVLELVTALLNALLPVLPPLVKAIGDLIVATAPLIGVIIEVAAKILDALIPVLPILADLFVKVIEAVIPLFPLIMDIVEAALPPFLQLLDAIVPILPDLADAFLRIVDAVIPLIPPLLRIIEVILPPLIDLFTWLVEQVLADAIPMIEMIVGEFEAWAAMLTEVLLAVEEFVNGVIEFFSDFETNIQQAFDDADAWLNQAGADIIAGLEKGVADAWDAFLDWAGGLWEDFVDDFTSFFGINSPSTVFAGFGGNLMQGLEDGMAAAKDSVINFAIEFGGNLNTEFETAITKLGEFWDTSWGSISGWFSGHMDDIVADGEDKNAKLDTNTRDKTTALSKWWDTAWDGVRNLFGGHLDGVVADGETKTGTLDRNTKTKIGGLSGWWDLAWRGVRTAFGGHADGVVGDGNTKMSSLDGNTRRILSGLSAWWDTHWDKMVTNFDRIFSRIGEIGSRIWGGIETAFRNGVNRVIGFVNGLIRGVNKVLSFVKLSPIGQIDLLAAGGTISSARNNVQMLAQGGRIGDGFVTNGPRAIVGEGNPNYPEYVIPTDPKYRSRAQALTQSAAQKVGLLAGGGRVDGGVRMLEEGGVLDWLKEVGSGAVGAVANVASNIASGAMGAFDNIASWISGGIAGTIGKVAGAVQNQMPDTLPGQVGRGGVGLMASGLINVITTAQKAIEAAALAAAEFGSSGASPNGVGGLGPRASAARSYALANFGGISSIGGYANRTIAGTNQLSDHALGKAIDVMISNYRSADGIAAGNKIANHFVGNAGQFGTKYVIWRDQINSGSGWKPYGHPSGAGGDTLQHRDHVHVSFFKKGGILDRLSSVLGGSGPRRALMDTGGWLPTGQTMVQNATGRAEAIIADPMTAFRNSFRDIFGWFAPRMEGAIERAMRDGYSKEASISREMINFWRSTQTRAGFQLTRPDNSPAEAPRPIGTGLMVPPIEVIPPPIQVPAGGLGAALGDTLSRLAPEFAMALEAGSREQISSFGSALLSNPARLAGLVSDLSAGFGGPLGDIQSIIAAIVTSAVPGTTIPTMTTSPSAAMAAAQGTVSTSTDGVAAPSVTVEAGAVTVTIEGNADAVTVAQLQQVLTDFQDQLVQEVVGSR